MQTFSHICRYLRVSNDMGTHIASFVIAQSSSLSLPRNAMRRSTVDGLVQRSGIGWIATPPTITKSNIYIYHAVLYSDVVHILRFYDVLCIYWILLIHAFAVQILRMSCTYIYLVRACFTGLCLHLLYIRFWVHKWWTHGFPNFFKNSKIL